MAVNVSPQPNSVWARIERAREALKWTDSKLSVRARLGGRSHYSLLKRRGFKADVATQEKIISCLEDAGYSGAWLRANVLPERSTGVPLPERPKIVVQLGLLAQKLGLDSDQIMRLWADLDAEGPLQKYPEDVQRAAFAAAYLENRTLEDVCRAVESVRSREDWHGASIDRKLLMIRSTLGTIKSGNSGTLLAIRSPPRRQ